MINCLPYYTTSANTPKGYEPLGVFVPQKKETVKTYKPLGGSE